MAKRLTGCVRYTATAGASSKRGLHTLRFPGSEAFGSNFNVRFEPMDSSKEDTVLNVQGLRSCWRS